MANRFSKIIAKVNRLPISVRPFLLTKIFCSKVPFAGTAKIKILKINTDKVELVLANRKRVQNHIKGIHATAAALLAETATGIAFGMHVPDDKIPLLKSMHIDYQRRMEGDLHASVCLEHDCISAIALHDKGSLFVPVLITDQSNEVPLKCEMEWAWVTKRNKIR